MLYRTLVCASLALFGGLSLTAQEIPLAWQASKYFRYNIENVTVSGSTVKVVFSVANPENGQPWDILTADPFKGGSASTLRVLVGWSSTEHTNTGSSNGSLNPILTTTQGAGAALPITINALSAAAPAKRCADANDCPGVSSLVNRFWVSATVIPLAFPGGQVTSGVVALEGHPACATSLPGCPAPVVVNGVPTLANVPVTAAIQPFSFGNGPPAGRRQIVHIDKCKSCHNDTVRDGVLIPKLSLHGGNRTENLAQCSVCHNPNQTDIPYRTAGAETPIDFKTMIHSIHAGGLRDNPFVVIGFRGTVHDFSTVRFPTSLRNCVACHIDENGRGTFELPLSSSVLGTTVQTGSVPAAAGLTRKIDVDPFNDVKITPTAAVCSSCHDDRENRTHMIRHGASFATTQGNIVPGGERCANCHGRGREKDVRRMHDIRSGTSSRD